MRLLQDEGRPVLLEEPDLRRARRRRKTSKPIRLQTGNDDGEMDLRNPEANGLSEKTKYTPGVEDPERVRLR